MRNAQARGGATLLEIEAVYRVQAPKLRRVAAGIVGDPESAQDVVQEAFAAAIRKRRSFLRRGSIEAWITRAVVNAALNRCRFEASRRTLVERAGAERAGGGAPADPVHGLSAAIARLPDRQRAAVFLHYYADLDYAAIGRALGIRSGTVGKLLHDARSSIAKEVGPR
jgi:RNA polymerase sigma-70 factor (ECF subfamily)